MGNVTDVLAAKFALFMLRVEEFNPGFMKICSKAPAVF